MSSPKKSHPTADAERLRRLRTMLGLSQRALAKEFKVTHGAIAAWESGKQAPPGPVLKLLELYEEELALGEDSGRIVRLKTSGLSRNTALSRTAASVCTQAAAAWLAKTVSGPERRSSITSNVNASIAKTIVSTVGELKGVALKAGQILGYLDYLLPEQQRVEIASLQYSSRSMSPAAAAGVVLEEFGELPRALFAEWSPVPFAAASIGQVHRARLRSGEEVAVKIQYPNIVQAIKSDLRSAEVLDTLMRLLFRGQAPGTFIAELAERFDEECDFVREAAHQEEFRRTWASQPGLRIPRVFPEFTRPRVLVTEFVTGETADIFARRASQAARDRAGLVLWKFAHESALQRGLFHADPHAGNFLFVDDDVVVLDFGCVKYLPASFRHAWKNALRAALERDREKMHQSLIELGIVSSGDDYDLDHQLNMILRFYEPWLREGEFSYTRAYAERAWRAGNVDNPNRFRVNTPKDYFFVYRLQLGLNGLLATLGARGHFRDRILDLLYDPGESRPDSFSDNEISLLNLA